MFPIRYLSSLEPKEKPKQVMPTSGHEDEHQSTKDHHQYLNESNAGHLKEVFSINVDTLMILVEDRIIASFSLIMGAIFSVKSFAWLSLLRKGSYFTLPVAGFV